jgi:predicted MFS family arabinose efflux permease
MLPLRLFRSRAFAAGNAVIFLLSASLTGSTFFIAQYLQVALGHDPLGAGLRLLPWGLAPFLLAARAGALADRLGERPLIVFGLGAQTAGMAWLAVVSTSQASYWALVVPMTLCGLGFAVAIPAVTKAVVSTSAPTDIGKASGAYSTMRQLGGAFGVAILAASFSASGTYASPSAFSTGFRPAMGVAAALALFGLGFGALLPARTRAAVGAGRRAAGAPA